MQTPEESLINPRNPARGRGPPRIYDFLAFPLSENSRRQKRGPLLRQGRLLYFTVELDEGNTVQAVTRFETHRGLMSMNVPRLASPLHSSRLAQGTWGPAHNETRSPMRLGVE